MTVNIRLKRTTQADWDAKNPIIPDGEPVLADDTGVFKIGDGVHHWVDLPVRMDAVALQTALDNMHTQLLGGAQAAWDTLQELKALIDSGDAADQSALSALTTVVGQKLAKAQNLADLADVLTARDNLGLGDVATKDMSEVVADPLLSAAFAPRWKPTTAYNAGDTVMAPDGSLVKAKTTFTSGASYSASNWTTVSATVGTQAKTELDAAIASQLDGAVDDTSADRQAFTANGTWTNPSPTVAKPVFVRGMTGGAGGGSGRRGAAGSLRTGGGGGAPGIPFQGWYLTTDLPATVPVFVGAGGAGGAAVTTDDTDGNPGATGGTTCFGANPSTYNMGFTNSASAGGRGGNSTGAAAGGVNAASGPTGGGSSATGGAGSNGVQASFANGLALATPGSGAAGAGLTTGNAAAAGGTAGGNGVQAGGSAGASGGGTGGTGPSVPAAAHGRGGTGGGGGGSQAAGVGGAGGAGGSFGGGGGGGAASVNGSASGAGGAGAPGYLEVVTFMALAVTIGGSSTVALDDLIYVADGDSLTEASSGGGTPYPTKLATLLGNPVVNRGLSGRTASEISLVAGGYAPVLTLTDSAIPASTTPITVTWDLPSPYSGTNTTDRVYDVTVQGVACVLTYIVTTGVVTLARKVAAGSPTPVPAKVTAVPVDPKTGPGFVHILWAGRNNYPKSNAQGPIVAAADFLRRTGTPFIILGVTTTNGDHTGTSDYTDCTSLNNTIRSLYPREFVDLRARLVREGCTLAGVTPTSGDNSEMALDGIAPSLYADSVHFNDLGRVAVAAIVQNELTVRGLA